MPKVLKPANKTYNLFDQPDAFLDLKCERCGAEVRYWSSDVSSSRVRYYASDVRSRCVECPVCAKPVCVVHSDGELVHKTWKRGILPEPADPDPADPDPAPEPIKVSWR